jgi:cbb3-type cytochrome oxidase subunit 1
VLYLAGMLIMAWNVFKTVAEAKPAQALIPQPV